MYDLINTIANILFTVLLHIFKYFLLKIHDPLDQTIQECYAPLDSK